MKYSHISNGAIVESSVDIRARYKNVSFKLPLEDQISTADGKSWYKEVKPQLGDDKKYSGNVVLIDGIPTHEVIDKSAQELSDDLDAEKASAIKYANDEAELERLKYITPGDGQSNSYQQKYEEAVSYTAAKAAYDLDPVTNPEPDEATFPYMFKEATETGTTADAIAALVISTRNQFVQLDAVIESKRRGYNVTIGNATTTSEVRTIKQNVSYGA